MIKMIKLTVVASLNGEIKKFDCYYDVTEIMSLSIEGIHGLEYGGNAHVGFKHGGVVEVMETIDEIMHIMGVSVDEIGVIE